MGVSRRWVLSGVSNAARGVRRGRVGAGGVCRAGAVGKAVPCDQWPGVLELGWWVGMVRLWCESRGSVRERFCSAESHAATVGFRARLTPGTSSSSVAVSDGRRLPARGHVGAVGRPTRDVAFRGSSPLGGRGCTALHGPRRRRGSRQTGAEGAGGLRGAGGPARRGAAPGEGFEAGGKESCRHARRVAGPRGCGWPGLTRSGARGSNACCGSGGAALGSGRACS